MKLTTTLEKMKENKHSVISLCQLLDFLAKNNKRDEEIDLLDILDSLGLYSFLLALEDVLEDKKRIIRCRKHKHQAYKIINQFYVYQI